MVLEQINNQYKIQQSAGVLYQKITSKNVNLLT